MSDAIRQAIERERARQPRAEMSRSAQDMAAGEGSQTIATSNRTITRAQVPHLTETSALQDEPVALIHLGPSAAVLYPAWPWRT